MTAYLDLFAPIYSDPVPAIDYRKELTPPNESSTTTTTTTTSRKPAKNTRSSMIKSYR
jgi:hypothetical protein